MKPTPPACLKAHDVLVGIYKRSLGYNRNALLSAVCKEIAETADIAPAARLIELIAIRDELQALGSSSSSS
jgi:hypothetical protein